MENIGNTYGNIEIYRNKRNGSLSLALNEMNKVMFESSLD